MTRSRALDNFEWPLVGLAAALLGIGLLTLLSATYEGDRETWTFFSLLGSPSPRLVRQLAFLAFALVVALVALVVDYRRIQTQSYLVYALGLGLLGLVLVVGETRGGSTRWLDLGPASLQPSEPMKILTVLALARYFARKEPRDSAGFSIPELLPAFGLIALPAGLIVVEPDLGTAILVVLVGMSVVVFVGIRPRSLVTLVLLAATAAPFMWQYGLKDYQRQRIATFVQPHENTRESWQIKQSKIAVGSGQIVGKGFLNGTQGRYRFLPAYHTDFIFAVWAEERGALGSFALLGLYVAFLLRGIGISKRAKDRYGAVLAVGLTSILFWHIVVNLNMVAATMPVVGVPLPFLSYGGTFLTTTLIITALLCNVSMRRYLF